MALRDKRAIMAPFQAQFLEEQRLAGVAVGMPLTQTPGELITQPLVTNGGIRTPGVMPLAVNGAAGPGALIPGPLAAGDVPAGGGGGGGAGEAIAVTGALMFVAWVVRHGAWIATRALSLGWSVTKLVAWLRKNVWGIAKAAGWVAAGAWLSDQLNLDTDEGVRVALEIAAEGQPRKRRRYTIGSNPRVRTLAKVARHTMRLLKAHEKVLKEFFPKKSTAPALKARETAHHKLLGKALD